jgi:hypothetical protein
MVGMCTLTWLRRADGHELFFNRDELRSRGPALPPARQRREGVDFLAPLDADHGGTWIATNEFGLSLCLLNGDESATPGASRLRISRGLLVLDLASCRAADEVTSRLERVDLARYRPFRLALFERSGGTHLAGWDGRRLACAALEDADRPLVSSSFATDDVRASRAARYRRPAPPASDPTELHLAFHESHEPERGPYSPCMHRPDARTVSFSRVVVDPRTVRFHYAPHAPCRGRPQGEPLTLAREPARACVPVAGLARPGD